MTVLKFIIVALVFYFVESISTDDNCSKQQFTDKGIIPKYADKLKSTNLVIQYGGKNISCGAPVNIMDQLNAPVVYYNAPSCCKNVTVIMFAPDPLVSGPYLNWLVYNIPPDNLRKGFTVPVTGNKKNNGFVAGDYVTPKDAEAGIFKKVTNVYLVYCQCGYISGKTKVTQLQKLKFDIRGFAEEKNLGTPMAGFFHTASPTGMDETDMTKDVPFPNNIS